MKKSVIVYTLNRCTTCLACLKACPLQAISLINNRVVINDLDCVNCGKCIKACNNQGLETIKTELNLNDQVINVALIPTSLILSMKNYGEVQDLFNAIKLMGFNEVVDLSKYEELVFRETSLIANYNDEITIASSCPLVNKLVEVKYPSLLDNLAPIKYPSEIAAKEIKDQYPNQEVVVYNFCECNAKLSLAKHPFDNNYEVDYSLAIAQMLPIFKQNFGKGKIDVNLSRKGLQAINPATFVASDNCLSADSFDKVMDILELAEFDVVKDYNLIRLLPCFNGCLGGDLLWGNSYNNLANLENILKDNKDSKELNLSFEEIYSNYEKVVDVKVDIKLKIKKFKEINKIYEQLPHFDCGACGYPSCRKMAEEICNGNSTIDDCKILRRGKENEG